MAEVDISKIQLPDGTTYNLKFGTKGVSEVDISKIVLPDGTVCNIKGGVLTTKSITANGIYNALSDNADGYSEVTVVVPNTYAVGDEGKVVQSRALVSQTSRTITSNGTYNTTTNNSCVVNVEASSAVKIGTITYTSNSYFEISASSTAYLPSLQARGCGGLFSVIGGIKATTYQYGKPSGGSQYGYYLDIPAGTTLLEISGLDIPSGKSLNVVGSMYSTGGNHYIEGEDSVSVSSGSILVKAPARLYAWFGNTTSEKAAGYNLYITGYFT